MRKYFGTDGVRGIANKELTCELAYSLGKAGAYVLGKGKEKLKVLVGKDTRISGDMLESALCAGLMSAGAEVVCLGVVPTPAVAYLNRKYSADCGVVISASHNPMEYNGIKFFNSEGYKLSDEIEHEIEALMEKMEDIEFVPLGEKIGYRTIEDNSIRDYASYLESIAESRLDGLKVVLDCANGAAYQVAPLVFKELGASVELINASPDGTNINVECGSTHPFGLSKRVVETGADMGFAYDGDADRLIAVDSCGNIVNGDHIMAICGRHLKEEGKLKGDTIVVTVMSNIGLHKAAKNSEIKLVQTNVGDRYVLEEMLRSGYNLGGEQSGHLIFLDYNTTGDGVLSSLLLASIVKQEGKSISELASAMTVYPQVLVNAKVKNENKSSFMEDDVIKGEIQKIENLMSGNGRVLIRPSGTEPLVRVMLEGSEEGQLMDLAKGLASIIESRMA
ncbi:MAG: phosphoglucosamine mutase [Peptoclostridium sp.]|uniref:phosphoglucosamine mutase n=1 Tax=Peptoclostridium sp. TaxID=1904860 RepID=UPI00139C3100|nr:phosphoglucosamine mutase [Peptoclostridium sp.]MZQ74545.1 phosphoglucosamine mutase [Peptoclostridium sp.]